MTALDPAVTARHIVRATARAALGTLLCDSGGAPYVSLVLVASDHDGAPLLLLSTLADHTRNLECDPRASLLFDGTGEREDPLAGERVTLEGRLQRSAAPHHRTRYLARHPAAAGYAGFGDFGVFRMVVERVHLIAGFGRVFRLDGSEVLIEPRPALVEQEASILAHMNDEHRDAVQLYARLLGRSGGDWSLTGIDPEGCDLRSGAATARLGFDCPVSDAEAARAELVRLVKRARAADAEAS